MCQSDAAAWPLWDAAEADLRAWARKARRRMREGRDVHVYFDNDAYGDARRNALRLLALLRGAR